MSSEANPITERTLRIQQLMRAKLGVRGRDFAAALAKAGRRLPRRMRHHGQVLANALPLAEHPKLRQTVDLAELDVAARELQAHLEAIDLADRRKGWILGVLGAIAFNMLVLFAIVVAVLVWRGFL